MFGIPFDIRREWIYQEKVETSNQVIHKLIIFDGRREGLGPQGSILPLLPGY